jgi:hypothetical protein
MSKGLDQSLFNRLALSRDLATRGSTLLRGNPNPVDAIQGIVLLDQSVEIAMQTTTGELRRPLKGGRFDNLLEAIPELQQPADVLTLHRIRNVAQHRGVAPRSDECRWARGIGSDALRVLFRLVGADFDTLSSVPQLASPHLREPLALGLALAHGKPADAAALAACAMKRVRGWIAHFTGNALVPHEMWVFLDGLWNDRVAMAACADNREEFLHAMLTLAAGSAMGIEPPALLRFSNLARGHRAVAQVQAVLPVDDASEAPPEGAPAQASARSSAPSPESQGFRFEHDPVKDEQGNATGVGSPTEDDAAWMIELVARCALRFEIEWPDLLLVEAEDSAT